MPVVDEGGVHARTRAVIDAEVVQVRIAAEQVAALVVDHQLLDEPVVLGHVQVVAGRRFAGPAYERACVRACVCLGWFVLVI